MNLSDALHTDLADFDPRELDEALATLGAAKLDLRQRFPLYEIDGDLRRINRRIDAVNQVYLDRQAENGRRRHSEPR